MSLSPEQLEARKHFLGGSEIGAVLGLNPWSTPWDIWSDKMGMGVPFEGNARTRMGDALEVPLIEWLDGELGEDLTACPNSESIRVEREAKSFLGCTPDGFVLDRSGDAVAMVECKYVGYALRSQWGTPGTDQVPSYVLSQCQWNMHVLREESLFAYGEVKRAYVPAAIEGNEDWVYYVVDYDQDLASLMEDAARKFWTDHVLTGKPPEIDWSDSCRRILGELYEDKVMPKELVGLATMDSLAEELRAQQDVLKAAKQDIETTKNRIRNVLGEHAAERFSCPAGSGSWRSDKNGRRTLRFKANEV